MEPILLTILLLDVLLFVVVAFLLLRAGRARATRPIFIIDDTAISQFVSLLKVIRKCPPKKTAKAAKQTSPDLFSAPSTTSKKPSTPAPQSAPGVLD